MSKRKDKKYGGSAKPPIPTLNTWIISSSLLSRWTNWWEEMLKKDAQLPQSECGLQRRAPGNWRLSWRRPTMTWSKMIWEKGRWKVPMLRKMWGWFVLPNKPQRPHRPAKEIDLSWFRSCRKLTTFWKRFQSNLCDTEEADREQHEKVRILKCESAGGSESRGAEILETKIKEKKKKRCFLQWRELLPGGTVGTLNLPFVFVK